tara:strand:- start:1189 stop:1290 length:102 start_codon:yes stop_codon:yes gene_type:complete
MSPSLSLCLLGQRQQQRQQLGQQASKEGGTAAR